MVSIEIVIGIQARMKKTAGIVKCELYKKRPTKSVGLERETGLEPATSTLARWSSTTELFPQIVYPLVWAVCERWDSNPHTEVLVPKTSVYTSFTTLAVR